MHEICLCVLSYICPGRRGYFELGTGFLSILSSQSRVQFRLTFHDSKAHLHASHAIEGGMYVEPVPDSHKFLWFVPIDYTDPETPIPRKFMVELEGREAGELFRKTFMECSEKMKGHVVNHKLVSLLAAGSPRKEMKGNESIGENATSPYNDTFKTKEVTPAKSDDTIVAESVNSTPVKTNSAPLGDQLKPETKPHDICANLKLDFELYSKEILESDHKEDTAPEVLTTSQSKDEPSIFCGGEDWSKFLEEPADNSPDNSSQTAPVLDSSSSSHRVLNTSVEVVKEVLPPAELQAKEAEFSLPRGFYNYVNKSGCSGCVGCEGGGECDTSGTEKCSSSEEKGEMDQVMPAVPQEKGVIYQVNPAVPQTRPTVPQTPPAPSLYQALPVLNPAAQASPFGLKPSPPDRGPATPNISPPTYTGIFGISPTQPVALEQPHNIFSTNQSNSNNIFLQGNNMNSFIKSSPNEQNIFLQSATKEENIFLKSMPKEENIFAKSAPQAGSSWSESGSTESKAPEFNPFSTPPLPAKTTVTSEDYDEYEEEDYEEEDYEEYLNECEYADTPDTD